MYSTLSEVKRTCKLIASTMNNYSLYKELNQEASKLAPFEFVVEWESIAIYSNGIYYVIVYHNKNILEIYKTT